MALCMTTGSIAFSACSANAASPQQAPASVPGQVVDLTYAAEKALPTVVHIKYLQNSKVQTVEVQEDPFSDFFDPFGFFGRGRGNGGTQKRQVQTPEKKAAGSGVIISQDGYIVTNCHVVEGADELTVTLNDNREFSARIIGTDKSSDLALIKVDAKNLPAIKIGSSDALRIGEWVLAIGSPYSKFTNTVTAGVVSAKARQLGANGVEAFIQTDAAINQGNSGGALVNTAGELVGINAMLFSTTGAYSGIGFAIPTTLVNKVVSDLKEYGAVQRAYIGVRGKDALQYIDEQKEQGKDVDLGTMEGVYVGEVMEDGAAVDAGIEKGDVITHVDGKKVKNFAEMTELLNKKRPGDKVQLQWLHNKKEKKATVTLKNEQGNTKVIKDADLDVLGANFREVTADTKERLSIGYGLEVTKVSSGRMKDAGISKGFIILRVNDEPVRTINELQQLVKSASKSKEPVLYIKGVYPTGKRAYYAVNLENE